MVRRLSERLLRDLPIATGCRASPVGRVLRKDCAYQPVWRSRQGRRAVLTSPHIVTHCLRRGWRGSESARSWEVNRESGGGGCRNRRQCGVAGHTCGLAQHSGVVPCVDAHILLGQVARPDCRFCRAEAEFDAQRHAVSLDLGGRVFPGGHASFEDADAANLDGRVLGDDLRPRTRRRRRCGPS